MAASKILRKLLNRFTPVTEMLLLESGFIRAHEDVYVMGDLIIITDGKRFYQGKKRIRNMLQISNFVYGINPYERLWQAMSK